jgi:formylmethanofuran dehydrogenase subunit E
MKGQKKRCDICGFLYFKVELKYQDGRVVCRDCLDEKVRADE